MVPMIYFVNYPVIYPIIKTVFTEKYWIKHLKTQAYLLNHTYKIKIILMVQV